MLGVNILHPTNSGPDMLFLLLKALISISAPFSPGLFEMRTEKLYAKFALAVTNMNPRFDLVILASNVGLRSVHQNRTYDESGRCQATARRQDRD